MPRYFFNVVNDVKTQDFEGTELFDLAAAQGEAEKDIEEIKRNNLRSMGADWSRWSIEICDAAGTLLLIVPFSRN